MFTVDVKQQYNTIQSRFVDSVPVSMLGELSFATSFAKSLKIELVVVDLISPPSRTKNNPAPQMIRRNSHYY